MPVNQKSNPTTDNDKKLFPPAKDADELAARSKVSSTQQMDSNPHVQDQVTRRQPSDGHLSDDEPDDEFGTQPAN